MATTTTTTGKAMRAAISTLATLASRGPLGNALDAVTVTTSQDGLCLRATGQVYNSTWESMVYTIPAFSDAEETVTVHLGDVKQAAQSLKASDSVDVELSDTGIVLRCKSGTFALPSREVYDAGKLHTGERGTVLFNAGELSAKMTAALPFVSDDRTRHSLTFVNYNAAAGMIEASDGRQAIRAKVGALGECHSFLLSPSKAMKSLLKTMGKLPGNTVKVDVYDESLVLAFGPVEYTASCTGDCFPMVEQAIPVRAKATAHCGLTFADGDVAALAPLVKRCKAVDTRAILTANGRVEISTEDTAVNAQLGATVNAKPSDDDFVIALDPAFLVNALNASTTDMWMKDNYSPARFDSADGNTVTCFMPMRM